MSLLLTLSNVEPQIGLDMGLPTAPRVLAFLPTLRLSYSALILAPLPSLSMDGQPPSHDTWTPKSTRMSPTALLRRFRYVGGFFPNSQQFAISGGAFTSVTNYVRYNASSDFRSIPLGDLDLRLEILQNKYGVVNLRRGGNTARRLYSARIHGLPSDMSVAVYQGHNAEELRREIERYSGIRLFGVVNTCRISNTLGREKSGGQYITFSEACSFLCSTSIIILAKDVHP
ncbi:hypothetical protein B0H10DRAFT_1973792 [Mycena sp. CBHHK59/15]|nr:hypothetical protein B0H10DRAFT_1973792 [Mycena sp. CBHHK59/15]